MAMSGEYLEDRRQHVLDRLTEAFAADQIFMEDYESRVVVAQNARDDSELDRAVAGLQNSELRSGERATVAARPSAAALPNRIDARISGSSSLACVMGERNLTGDWLSADQVSALTVMGSTKLDLRDTALPPGRLKIDAFIFMGEMQIIVPRGLPVNVNAFPFMGEARADRGVEHRVQAGRPFVEVNGFAMMGSIRVILGD